MKQATDTAGNKFLDYPHNSPNFSMYLYPVTNLEIVKCITAFKTSSSGYDDISPVVLKHVANFISVPLTHTVNLTLKTGIFPDPLKKSQSYSITKIWQ